MFVADSPRWDSNSGAPPQKKIVATAEEADTFWCFVQLIDPMLSWFIDTSRPPRESPVPASSGGGIDGEDGDVCRLDELVLPDGLRVVASLSDIAGQQDLGDVDAHANGTNAYTPSITPRRQLHSPFACRRAWAI